MLRRTGPLRTPCRATAARSLGLLLGVIALGGPPLLGAGLEVVPPAEPGFVDLVRGQPRTVVLRVRNAGSDALDVGSLEVLPSDASRAAPPPKVIGLDGASLGPGRTTSVALALPPYPDSGEWGWGLHLRPRAEASADQPFYRFAVRVREPAVPVIGPKKAGWLASLLAALVVVLTFYVRASPDGRGPRLNFFQSPDGAYSVSRFQVWIWTVVVLFSYGYLFLSRGVSPDFPDSIWALLGISVASTTTATVIAVRGQPGSEPVPAKEAPAPPAPAAPDRKAPTPLVSMLSEDGRPSVMRLQLFAWTIATTAFFVKQVFATGVLWDVPANLLILMGISHGGYLVDKVAEKPRQ